MTSEYAREAVETIDLPTVCKRGPFLEFQKTVNKWESSKTSEHARKTAGTIDRSSVRERKPFLEFQKVFLKIQNYIYFRYQVIITRGPRGPWNAHLRVKIFKSSLFSLLYIQQATPGGLNLK